MIERAGVPLGGGKSGWLGKPPVCGFGRLPRLADNGTVRCWNSENWAAVFLRTGFSEVVMHRVSRKLLQGDFFFPPSYFLGVRSEGSTRCSRSCMSPAFGASLSVCFLLMLIYLKVKEQSCWEAEVCVLAALKFLRTGSHAGCVPGLRGLCADISPHHLRFFSVLATSTLIYFNGWRDCRCCR